MENGSRWAVLIILLIGSAFFSGAETALTSVNKVRIRNMVDEGNSRAKIVWDLIEDPSKLLGTILVGNNVVNIAASALATSIAIEYFGSSGVGYATGIMTLLVLIFGEITPKSLATENAETVSLKIAPIVSFLQKILSPIVFILLQITKLFSKLFGKNEEEMPSITESELKTMIDVSQEEGVLEGEEKDMLVNVFDFKDSPLSKIMTPRTDMIAIEVDSSFKEVVEVYKEYGYSRYPVYKENRDDIVGIFSIKDVALLDENEDFHLNKFLRKPIYLFETQRATKAFEELRTKKITMGVVIDEYGGTSGIITIEDLIEEIVGDIEDEYDYDDEEIKKISDKEYIVLGSMKLDEISEELNLNIKSEEFDTIGGYIIGKFGEIPEKGDEIIDDGILYRIEEKDKNRIEKLRIKKP